jgi:hypothetical protein
MNILYSCSDDSPPNVSSYPPTCTVQDDSMPVSLESHPSLIRMLRFKSWCSNSNNQSCVDMSQHTSYFSFCWEVAKSVACLHIVDAAFKEHCTDRTWHTVFCSILIVNTVPRSCFDSAELREFCIDEDQRKSKIKFLV